MDNMTSQEMHEGAPESPKQGNYMFGIPLDNLNDEE
jgi:hypothetical protein